MKKSKKSLLIACVLGDGYIAKSSNSKSCTLEIIHSNKQKEYIEWKADLLRKATGKKIPLKEKIVAKRTIIGKETPELLAYRITCTHKYFRVLRKWLYPNNKKKLSPKYIQYLDPLGLAIWYMDDGSKEGTSGYLLCTHFFSNEDIEIIQNVLLFKFGINTSKHKDNAIYIMSDSKLAFKNLIEPYIVESMKYKL